MVMEIDSNFYEKYGNMPISIYTNPIYVPSLQMEQEYTYLAIEIKDFGTEITHEFPTTRANDRFTFPRVMRMWSGKAKRLYRVYNNGVCDIIKEEV